MTVELANAIPATGIEEVTALFIPGGTDSNAGCEFVIQMSDREFNLRELAAYLVLADRFYGRMADGGLASYSRRRDEQLVVQEVRHGSVELVFDAPADRGDGSRLVLLYLLLRFLPFVHAESAATAHRASIRHYVNGSILASRENRKELRQRVAADPLLQDLPAKRFSQLIAFLDQMYTLEAGNLAPAIRFASSWIRSTSFRLIAGIRNTESPYTLAGSVLHYSDPMEPVALDDWSAVA